METLIDAPRFFLSCRHFIDPGAFIPVPQTKSTVYRDLTRGIDLSGQVKSFNIWVCIGDRKGIGDSLRLSLLSVLTGGSKSLLASY